MAGRRWARLWRWREHRSHNSHPWLGKVGCFIVFVLHNWQPETWSHHTTGSDGTNDVFTVSCGFPSVFQCGLQRDPTSTKTILSTGSGRFEQYHGRNCQGVSSKSSGSLAKATHMNNGLSLGGWSLTCEWEKCFHIECLGKRRTFTDVNTPFT